MHLHHLGAGLQTMILDYPVTRRPVQGQGLAAFASGVQSSHQHSDQTLITEIIMGEVPKRFDHGWRIPCLQFGGRPGHDHLFPLLPPDPPDPFNPQ